MEDRGAADRGAVASSFLLSVVVPAHNAEAHLPVCLRALAMSDLPRKSWQLIVVDDGSTDNTRTIAEADADIVLTTGDVACGPGYARNRGAAVASGDVIAFIDADVAVHPDSLRLMVERLSADATLVAVFGSYDDSPADSALVSRYRNLLHHYAHNQTAGHVSTFWAGCGAVRATAFRKAGGFDEIRYPRPQIEDIELGYRLTRIGGILLDPSIQGKHFKRWSVGSMMTTDFRDRAVPWVRLLLSQERDKSASTPSLGPRALLATAAAGGAAAAAVLGAAGFGALAWLAALALFLGCVALNARFYAWLWRQGGPSMLSAAIPLHFGYQLLSAAAVPIGAGSYLVFDENTMKSVDRPRVAGTRFFALAFGETGARLIAFAATAYLARRLGASEFGQIGFATAVLMHFGPGLLMGVGEVGAREVAREPEKATVIAATGITLRLLGAIVAITSIIALASIVGVDPERRTVTSLYALCVIPLALDTGWVYKGLGRTGRIGASLLIVEASVLLLVMLFINAPGDVTKVPLIQLAGALAAAGFLTLPLMRGHWRTPSLDSLRDMARRTPTITISRLLRVFVVSLDVVLLGFMVSSQEVGWYSAAYRIVFFVMALLYAAHAAFLPEMAQSADNPRALSAILSRAIGMALAVTVPFVVGGVLIAQPMMNLIFGAEYQAGAGALRLLLFSLVLLAVHSATRSVFLVMHRPGLETIIIAIGVATNVALNLYLIPRYGIEGAAVATVAGEAVILSGAFVALAQMGLRPGIRNSFPALIAGVILAAVLLAIPSPRPVFASIAAGGIAYVMALGAATILLRPRASLAQR